MAQVIKGNPSHKQAPPNTQNRGSGMIVGAVNKAVEMHPTVIATATAAVPIPAPAATVANPNAIMQAQLPPGMIAISHQAIAMSTPVQPTILPSHNGALSPTNGALLDHLALANTKEKTPMCLINELARFNKIQHQYTLTDEQGPAHKKTFFVKLKLGEEEYSASGPSIKKAQHAAADIALEQTQYKHPPPKPPRSMTDGSRWDSDSITPTVELNALAMKRGEPAVYHPIEMQPRPPQFYPPANMDFRGMYNQRYHYPVRAPTVFYVSLKVGQREFIGEGRTRQAARHNAADKALKVLRNLPLPIGMAAAADKKDDGGMVVMSPSAVVVESVGETAAQQDMMDEITDGMNGLMDQKDALKSEISLVHEIALKRNMPVNFEVTRESGPPHMRTFVTRCSCGELLYEADGNSKKLSKKRAAEGMLEKLRELPGILAPSVNKPKKSPGNKKKNRNLIKVEKATPDYGVGINPISRLIQIQQAKKEKEPVYLLFAERGLPRRREFVMQVSVGDQTCTGVGPNKKLAKRNAAEAMLQQLGYSRPAPQPSKPAIKSEPTGVVTTDKKVTFLDNQAIPTSRQLVPGVILMSDVQRAQAGSTVYITSSPQNTATASIIRAGGTLQPQDIGVKFSPQTTAAIAKELLDTGASPTAESITKSCAQVAAAQSVVRPKQQLLYLADVLGFQVQFTDFPKGNNRTEYLSLVSLSTTPPQVSHGAGTTIEASHDQAAITALTALSELGLDAVVPSSSAGKQDLNTDNGASGDGLLVKDEMKLANSVTDVSNKTAETK